MNALCIFLILTSVFLAESYPSLFGYPFWRRNNIYERNHIGAAPSPNAIFIYDPPMPNRIVPNNGYDNMLLRTFDRRPIPLVASPDFGHRLHGPANDPDAGSLIFGTTSTTTISPRVEKTKNEPRPASQRNEKRRKFGGSSHIEDPQETRILVNNRQKFRGPKPQESTDATDFVFPDYSNYPTIRFKPPAGGDCDPGVPFCEDAKNYPSQHILNILKNSAASYQDFLGSDVIPFNITQRIDPLDELPLCQSREEVVYPKKGQNKEKEWLYIVNQDDYVQGVRIERCQSESGPCQLADGVALPLGYTTMCKQKYIYRKMLAVDGGGAPKPDNFMLPSCCSCYFKKDAQALASFGKPGASPAGRP